MRAVRKRDREDPKTAPKATMRCAVYTRKSSDEGLDQEFNSLDAQRDAAEAYIMSQRAEGWACLPDRYDDGGFSGGSMDRPALDHLLRDIEAGRIDCVVVYKVDRLSRSLMDFARIMQLFEQHGVSFVSVTQQFNTTSSMGRLTLNILLSFAQFEREIIGERIRDKIAAQKRKGKWAGGVPVLGYDVDRSGPSPRLLATTIEAPVLRMSCEQSNRQKGNNAGGSIFRDPPGVRLLEMANASARTDLTSCDTLRGASIREYLPRLAASVRTPQPMMDVHTARDPRLTAGRSPHDSSMRRTTACRSTSPCKTRSRPVTPTTSAKKGYTAMAIDQ